MKPTLRIALPRDAEAIRQVYAYYIEHTEATFNEVLKPVEAYRQEIETLLRTYPYLIAQDENGGFLGFACAEPMRPQTGYRYSVELTIYLHPDAPRHSGIGKALYRALLTMLKEQGFTNAYGVLNAANEDSLALHVSFGFTQAAVLPNCAYKHGKWLSALWMHKALNPLQDPPKVILPFETYRKAQTVV